MWRVRGGWGREVSLEKRLGVFLGITTVQAGDAKQPDLFSEALRNAGLSEEWAAGQQVHGRRVRAARRPTASARSAVWERPTAPEAFPATDGVVTDRRNLPLRVFTADCVPVFIVDPVKNAVGMVHAGWRGVHKKILSCAVKTMGAAYGSRPKDLWVTLGPHIHACCYEVGGDAARAFQKTPGALRRKGQAGADGEQKYFLDLSACLRIEAGRLGVPAPHFSTAPHCTAHDERFFSYRREKTEKRQAAVIVLL
ncbi:MAG: peptidoglycan editing factor PgeF [Elusimicrobia bacterium]|nr:peptidoglycan editing factor PgeF [Elusimicrobiota bacterium]